MTSAESAQAEIARADELARAGHFQEAYEIYQALLAGAPPALQPLWVRRGLIGKPRPETPLLMTVLNLIEQISPQAFVGEGLATWRKILPFMHDARFREIADRHAHLLPLPNWQWNLQTALWAVNQARRVPGDFVELGVFKGHTTLFCAEYVRFEAWPKRWWLYDTFEGIPADQVDPGWEEANKAAYAGAVTLEEVQARFAEYPNITVIQGRVPEVLDEGGPEAIAFMHVDLNNATAEIAALDRLYDRLSPGGIILFDDYGWIAAHAQFRAENRWFGTRGLALLSLPTGQALFVKPAG
jgi:SAM-dependent methyltransferase